MKKKLLGMNTRCVHSGTYIDKGTGGVNTPIFTSTSFRYTDPSDSLLYPRAFNIPSQMAPAQKICDLEGGERGLVLGSGMAAISTVLFALLGKGNHAVFQRELYGGTHGFVMSELEKFGIEISFTDGSEVEDFKKEIRPNTKVMFIETPSNPLLGIIDLEAISELASRFEIVTVIDNTFATPINQTPMDFGMDIVVHSGTKYLSGHSDVLSGAIVTSEKLMDMIFPYALNHGGTLAPHACYMLERSLKTLGLRIERQNASAMELASFLEGHKLVVKVNYPGLEGNMGHETAKKQMRGFGGMFSFELGCDKAGARRFIQSLEFITPAVSLGGVESLISFPSETSHAKMSPEEQERAGIKDTLIRISVGIEDVGDLKEDLENALRSI